MLYYDQQMHNYFTNYHTLCVGMVLIRLLVLYGLYVGRVAQSV